MENTELDGDLQMAQSGRDSYALQNSQMTIQRSFISLGGQGREQSKVDWEWAMRILQQQQPEIRTRLNQTLFGEMLLDVVDQPERVAQLPSIALEARKTLTMDGGEGEAIDPRQPIVATYAREEVQRRLLILGTPGSGKTTLLLKLAEQLVGEAIAQPKTVIPIIFELSTWRDDKQSIEDWLLAQLYENFGGDRKRKIYEPWLEKQVLLPLLDGLDELGLVRQKLCTEKINEFARTHPQLVVCCRVQEFRQAGVKLSNLRGAVCLQPLSDGQIQEYLGQVGKLELWQQIQAVPEMAKLLEPVAAAEIGEDEDDLEDEGDPGLLRVPLFIGLAARVYDPQKPLLGKADLFERYIDRQLSPEVRENDRLRKDFKNRQWAYKTLAQEPDWRDVRRSLGWLAGQLQDRNQVELLIEKMQPSWLDEGRSRWLGKGLSRWLYQMLVGVLVGLLVGLVFGLIGERISVQPIVWLVGLLAGLINGVNDIDIKPVEAFKLPMSPKARQEMVRSLQQELFLGLVLGLIFRQIVGLFVGLITGLFFGLITGLFVGLQQDLKMRKNPNQGIRNSLQSTLWTAGLGYPVLVIVFMATSVTKSFLDKKDWINLPTSIFRNALQFLLPGLFVGLLFALCIGGGIACIQHLCLRLILTQNHKIPWNYARFLNYCVERRLLQRIGGRYRFIHRELLDHFVQQPR